MKKRSSINIAILVGIVLIVLVVLGIGGESILGKISQQNKVENAVLDSKVVLNYYTWEKSELTNPIIDEFEKKYPDIKVNVKLIPDVANSASSELDNIALGSGDMDIWPIINHSLKIKNGMCRSLDEYIKKDGINMEKSFGSAAESSKFNGKIYGIPFQSIVTMVFYNKDMFDKAGLEYPRDDWTYHDLYNISKKLTNGKGTKKVYGFMQNWFMISGGRLGNTAVPFYSEEGLSNFGSEDYWEKTLILRKKMEDEGLELTYEKVKAKDTYSSVEFLNERAAMTLGASWVIRDMKDKQSFPFNFRVGCVLLPRIDSSVENIKQISSTESIFSIPMTSKHPDEAWKFIKFYVENGSESIAKSGNVPVYRPAYSDALTKTLIKDSGLNVEDGELFFTTSTQGHYAFVPMGAAVDEYEKIILYYSGQYLSGKGTIKETINNIEKKANEAILNEKAEMNIKK